jgi:ABC-type lipoprotein release transport system permease subunit
MRDRWLNDLVIGIRLAVAGGRTAKSGVVRLILGTVGVGLAVMVLLVVSSVGAGTQSRGERSASQVPLTQPVPGVDPLYLTRSDTVFRDAHIGRLFAHAGGPNAPVPPGVDRIPGPDEAYVSPALAKLLVSPDGELLRPRFPQRILGTVAQAGLVKPNDLAAVLGSADSHARDAVYGFGAPYTPSPMPPPLLIVLVVGMVTVLVPVFIFVATSARIAGAERDRRLAALRLVGAGAKQVRRIAAAESLVSAATGLLFGGGLFLLIRASAADIEVSGEGFFPSDLTPSWGTLVTVLVVVPVLALLVNQFALRRTVIEPLGVVRVARPVSRRVAWRLLVIVIGVVLLLAVDGSRADEPGTMLMIMVGATLLLVSVPTVLPWLLERMVAPFQGGGIPSFQLAVRRLQLDTATPARVVSGLAVVLAGAITLQMVMMAELDRIGPREQPTQPQDYAAVVSAPPDTPEAAWAAMDHLPGAELRYRVQTFYARQPGQTDPKAWFVPISVVDCVTVLKLLTATTCIDGDAFTTSATNEEPDFLAPGARLDVEDGDHYDLDRGPLVTGAVTLPATIRPTSYKPDQNLTNVGSILLTPAAAHLTPNVVLKYFALIGTDGTNPDALEHVRNAVEPYRRYIDVSGAALRDATSGQMFVDLRKGLLVGTLFTLVLAGMSLLVVGLEQTRERRRAIAGLAATGVPIRTLVRSLLWQNAIPMLLAVILSITAGVGLALLVFRMMELRVMVDWPSIGIMAATAAVVSLLITVLTLPTLRSATRLAALRTE